MTSYQQKLTRDQKQAISLLSIGTFLEYFDLMLYVHMAVLLNTIFFSPDNTYSVKMLSAFAYCSTFVFRPFGALLFGWLGDTIGRKPVIIITTFLMACTCIGVTAIPSYAKAGFTASVLITLCRAIQGISSAAEVTGAQIYITEITKPPIQYPAVASITIFSTLGTMIALGTATIITSTNLNWRYAFLFGAFVAGIGTLARTTLKETPDFVDAKRRLKLNIEKTGHDPEAIEKTTPLKEKTSTKTLMAYFIIQCTPVTWSYFSYFFCGNILIDDFNYSAEQVIHHNFLISIGDLLGCIVMTYLSYKIYPLKILKTTFYILVAFLCTSPFIIPNLSQPAHIMAMQLYFLVLGPSYFPATAIFYKHFPVFKRFTHTSLIFALSRALVMVITSFGFAYLTEHFDYWGILMIMVPVSTGYYFGLRHFENLEKNAQTQVY